MFSTIKKFLSILSKIKFDINLPNNSNILLYDTNLSNQFINFFKNHEKIQILNTRYERINLLILINSISKNGFKNLMTNYVLNYIKFTRPKLILTFNDISPNFYLLKDKIDKKIITISVQQSFRNSEEFKHFKKKVNYKVDYLLTYGKIFDQYYKKLIVYKKILHIGSFLNNLKTKKITRIRKNEILFISQFKNYLSDKEYNKHEKNLLILLKNFCDKKNINYKIIIRKQYSNSNDEESIYKDSKKIFKSNFNFIDYKNILITNVKKKDTSKKITTTYDIIDQYENILIIDSSMGFEILSRKKKLIAFPLNKYFRSKKNFFISRELNAKIFEQKLSKIISMKSKDYFKKIEDTSFLIPFDKRNKILKKLVLETCKKVL
tara:strand:- start:1836 stop:2969 length:1134 start_codon:yes stop_codon:yes gene_type:complete